MLASFKPTAHTTHRHLITCRIRIYETVIRTNSVNIPGRTEECQNANIFHDTVQKPL